MIKMISHFTHPDTSLHANQIEHASKGWGERRLVVTKAELLYVWTLTAATQEKEREVWDKGEGE